MTKKLKIKKVQPKAVNINVSSIDSFFDINTIPQRRSFEEMINSAKETLIHPTPEVMVMNDELPIDIAEENISGNYLPVDDNPYAGITFKERPKQHVITNVSVGSDFEVFLFDKDKNKVVNAEPYVKGSKLLPFNFDNSNPFWTTSLDNVLAEGNIPPCTTQQEFNSNIEYVLEFFKKSFPKNIEIINDPAVTMDEEELNTPTAKEFGCTPSLNAYTGKKNPSPNGRNTNLRTGAFHIHLKYDDMEINNCTELIRILDLFLGLPALLLEPPNERRKLYGTAGEFRFGKTLEYRVLSTYFCKDEFLRKWVFQNTMHAIDFYNNNDSLKRNFLGQHSTLVKNIINRNAIIDAEELVERYNIPLYLRKA